MPILNQPHLNTANTIWAVCVPLKCEKFFNLICVTDPRDRDSPIAKTCRDMSFLDSFVRPKLTTVTIINIATITTPTTTTVVAATTTITTTTTIITTTTSTAGR